MGQICHVFTRLALAVKEAHEKVGLVASGHDTDHDLEVAELAHIIASPVHAGFALLAGCAGLLHSSDRILERQLSMENSTISQVPKASVRDYVRNMLHMHTSVDEANYNFVIEAVVHHGSKPNQEGDNLVMIAVADADRLANMGATLPIRSGQHYPNLRILNPVTMQIDMSDRTSREKYNSPDSVLFDLQNAIDWYRNPTGPYALRLPKALEIGQVRAERLERLIQDIKEERELVGLYPYPACFFQG